MKKACLGVAGQPCGRLFEGRGPRCPMHAAQWQRNRDAARGSRQARGYNREYEANRRALLADGPWPCHWCGREATTADHLVPLAHGGTNDPDNLIPSCAPCNSSRGSRSAPSPGYRR